MTFDDRDPGLQQLADMRQSYQGEGLRESDLAPDPLAQFARWLADAVAEPLPEPNAMVVSTAALIAADHALPSSRTVLLKAADERGFTFYTNLGSRKGRELSQNPWASLVFPWFSMSRQVVIVGHVEQVDRAESAAYFASRPYGSRLGAWASAQSTVLASREVLKARYAELAAAFPDTGSATDVPLPDFWGGLLVRPITIEFWQGRVSRLHDRLRFSVDPAVSQSQVDVASVDPPAMNDPDAWLVERLSP
jgi:pyridoxamine 5'-phosphate oxidase